MSHRRRRMVLDSPSLAWIVQTGSVAAIVEPAEGSDLPRATRVLATFSAGEPIFGLGTTHLPGALSRELTLHLEVKQGTTLKPVLIEDFITLCREDPHAALPHVNRLVRSLAAIVSNGIPPADARKLLAPGGNYTLPKAFKASAMSGALWFKLESGAARFGDREELRPLDPRGIHPLAGNLWLRMLERGKVICLDPLDVIREGDFFNGVRDFAALALQVVYEDFATEGVREIMQLSKSAGHRQARLSTAMERALGIMDRKMLEADTGYPALEAVRQIGLILGVEMDTPPRLRPNPEDQIKDMCAHNGLASMPVFLEPDWHTRNLGPMLAYLRTDENPALPVALAPRSRGFAGHGYYMLNPAENTRERVTRKRARDIAPQALRVYAPLPEEDTSAMGLLSFALQENRLDLAGFFAQGLAGGLCGLGVPVAMYLVANKVVAQGYHGLLWHIVIGLAALVLGGTMFELTRNTTLSRLASRSRSRLRAALFARLLKLPISFFRKYSAGDLASRVNAVDSLGTRLSEALSTSLLSSAFALTGIPLLFLFSWPMALTVCCAGFGTLGLAFLFLRSRSRTLTNLRHSTGSLAGLELQLISGMDKLRTAGAESTAFGEWMGTFTRLRKNAHDLGRAENLASAVGAGIPLLCATLVFALFIGADLYQGMSLGGFLCFNTTLAQVTAAFAALITNLSPLAVIPPLYDRLRPIVETMPEDRSHGVREDPGDLRGAISVLNVSFSYEEAGAPALSRVSLDVEPGGFVAIVGESGSGKSTLLQVMLGLLRPLSGEVLYDGKELSRLDPTRLRRQIGTVIQNGDLAQGDILLNIMGAEKRDDEDAAWEAARLAALDMDIAAMPMGMRTFVPHGGGIFSGGQKQRIRIARALARKPKIVFLDEATSNLDNPKQAQIMRNIGRMQATRVVIAHRLSTVEKADRIYVMHNGRIVESGTFLELKQQGGLFARMAARQTV